MVSLNILMRPVLNLGGRVLMNVIHGLEEENRRCMSLMMRVVVMMIVVNLLHVLMRLVAFKEMVMHLISGLQVNN